MAQTVNKEMIIGELLQIDIGIAAILNVLRNALRRLPLFYRGILRRSLHGTRYGCNRCGGNHQ